MKWRGSTQRQLVHQELSGDDQAPPKTPAVTALQPNASTRIRTSTKTQSTQSKLERIDPGNTEFGVENTPKIVSGLQECCLQRTQALYAGAGVSVVPAGGVREAAFSKLLENTYRQVNISLVNQLVMFARALGVDLLEAIRLAVTKPFGFQAFYHGPGVGGHCISIDLQYLATRIESELGETFRFLELAREINGGMPEYVVARLASEMDRRGSDLEGKRVMLLGITYKRNVPDMRDARRRDCTHIAKEWRSGVIP